MPDVTLMGATYPDVPAVTLPSGESTATFYDLGSLDLVTSVNGATGDVTVQPTLVSGTNIKTINDQSLLGSGDLTISEGTEMVVLAYGKSTWADFLAAYPNAVVYCRASSNSNPASGSQTRMAFMAYVNNETNPTNVEFQYYRSVSSHSATQQGDQVYVYKLDKTAGWSVTTREAYTRITAGTGMTQSYSGGVLTLQAPRELPTVTSSDDGKVLGVVNGAWAATEGGGGNGTGGVTVRGARVTIPRRTSTAQSATVTVGGLGEIDAHDIILFFGAGGYEVLPYGMDGSGYKVHVSGVNSNAFDAFAAIISPNYEVGTQASIVGATSMCSTTTPLVGDTVTITATSGYKISVYDAASGGLYASPNRTLQAGETWSFTVECATSYIAAKASGGDN